MATYFLQLSTFPVPRYQTVEPTYDPMTITAPRGVVKADSATADHGDQTTHGNFEVYLNRHGTLKAKRYEKRSRFDPAEDIEAQSIYLSPVAETADIPG